MAPLEFMQRLALVPRPRLHLIRFHGVLAPNAKLRREIVPSPPEQATAPACDHAQGADLRLFVLNGEVIATMQRTAMAGDFRANIHLGAEASVHVPSVAESAMAIKATALLGLDVAGVDIIQSDRGPLLLEVNASPGFEALERVSGVDVAGKMLDLLISRK